MGLEIGDADARTSATLKWRPDWLRYACTPEVTAQQWLRNSMQKVIAYDLTHLVSRLMIPSPTGIDRVDLAFGRHFASCDPTKVMGVHYGLKKPHVLAPQRIGQLVGLTDDMWRENQDPAQDEAFARVANWLNSADQSASLQRERPHGLSSIGMAGRWMQRARFRILKEGNQHIPSGACYINTAQHLLDSPRYFRWLSERPDIKKIFALQDLLPLQYPEYFKPNYKELFDGCIALIAEHADAVITTTAKVQDDITRDLRRRGKTAVPVLAAPLPSPLGNDQGDVDPALSRHPYFVATGTIEPRKNHLLLLEIWRELARLPNPPRLIIIGTRGWENEQVLDLLERCEALRPLVLEASNLSSAGMRNLIQNSCGALCPSFGEGYGLPLVEALSLGTPVVASDIEVFHEVSQGRAQFASPINGPAWIEAILALADRNSQTSVNARAMAAGFRSPNWKNYFTVVDEFIDSL